MGKKKCRMYRYVCCLFWFRLMTGFVWTQAINDQRKHVFFTWYVILQTQFSKNHAYDTKKSLLTSSPSMSAKGPCLRAPPLYPSAWIYAISFSFRAPSIATGSPYPLPSTKQWLLLCSLFLFFFVSPSVRKIAMKIKLTMVFRWRCCTRHSCTRQTDDAYSITPDTWWNICMFRWKPRENRENPPKNIEPFIDACGGPNFLWLSESATLEALKRILQLRTRNVLRFVEPCRRRR